MHVTSGQIEIPFLGVTRRRRNLRRQERTALVATLADAADPGWQETVDRVQVISTAGSGQPVEQPEPLPEWDVDVVIRLLGPLSVETAGGEDISFVRGTTAEFVAYLAHHRRGVSIDATMEALWPNAEPKRPWINNLSSDARKALGPDRDGELLLPRMTGDGLYRLSPRVGTDLERFEQLVEHATAGGPPATGALRLALDLVTGPPYASVGSGWPQLEGSATRAILAVDEAARALAVMALEAGDVDLADWATGQGLLANPASSELHLLRLRAAAARGHGELAVEAVYQQYRAVTLGDDDQPEGAAELDPRIVELYTSYRRSRPANWVAGGDGARAGANERTEPADDERGHAGRAGAGQGNGDAHPGGDGGPERRDGGRRGRQPPLPPPDRSRTGGHGPGPRPAG
jgi:hypothetical protein